MELPQLFGSEYALPAIVVVVLLLAILGLIMLRRRQQESTAESAGDQQGRGRNVEPRVEISSRESRKAAALAAKAEREASEAAAAAVADSPEAPAATAVEPALNQSDSDASQPATDGAAATAEQEAPPPSPPSAASPKPAPKKRGKAPTDAGPRTALSTDPLQAVLDSILAGWGDLTDEDTNRLEVFRREKVLAAIAELQVPKEGKGYEYARTRLTQLRRYATQLEQDEKRAPASEAEEQEFVGMASGAVAAPAATPAAAQSTPPATVPETAGAAAAAAAAGAAGMAASAGAAALAQTMGAAQIPAAGTLQQSPRSQTRSWFSLEPEEPEKPVESAQKTTQAAQPRDWTAVGYSEDTEETAGSERAGELEWGSDHESRAQVPDEIRSPGFTWRREEDTPAPAPAAANETITETITEAAPETATEAAPAIIAETASETAADATPEAATDAAPEIAAEAAPPDVDTLPLVEPTPFEPFEEAVPFEEIVPVEETVEEAVPLEEVVEEAVPVVETMPVAEETPVTDAVPFGEVVPFEEVAPFEEVTPFEEAAPVAEEATPFEEVAPVVEEAAAVEEAAPVEEAASDEVLFEEAAPAQPAPAEPDKSAKLVADYSAEPTWGSRAQTDRTTEEAVADAAAAFWSTPEASRKELTARMLSRNVTTAADIFALPEDERVEMLAFLDASELVKVLKTTEDRELKKGVIDTLEHIGGIASLDAIQASLDDPDPEIQLYALDAADRLLGKNT